MREIKFKFWLAGTNKMTYAHTLSDIFGFGWFLTEDIIPLQYTGFKDCNGVEIYEGDILKHSDKYGTLKVEVIFQQGSFRFIGLKEHIYWNFLPSFENIGNVYENPEYLNL